MIDILVLSIALLLHNIKYYAMLYLNVIFIYNTVGLSVRNSYIIIKYKMKNPEAEHFKSDLHEGCSE